MNPPVFAHGHLRLYLLSLLEEQPRHGYELIQALSERFDGAYAPSAGTIYPRLAKLEEEGLVTKETSGRKTVYAITPAGREEVERRRHELDEIESNVEVSVRRIAEQVREGLTTATAQLREELKPFAADAKVFGAQAQQFATETAERARRAFAQQQAPIDPESQPRPQDAPEEPADGRPRGFADEGAGSGPAPSAGGEQESGSQGAPAADAAAAPASEAPDLAAAGLARKAELAIEAFRQDLRRELREAERGDRLSPAILAMIEGELERVRQMTRRALGHRD